MERKKRITGRMLLFVIILASLMIKKDVCASTKLVANSIDDVERILKDVVGNREEKVEISLNNLDYHEVYNSLVSKLTGLGDYNFRNIYYVCNGGTSDNIVVELKYYDSLVEDEELSQLLKPILADWKDYSDYKKIKSAHDYICTSISYSEDEAEKNYINYRRSAYDAFTRKETVCIGYALLFQKMMDMLDVPCYTYIDHIDDGHAWNIVRLDNQWYQLDCTWDAKLPAFFNHRYFLKGEMSSHEYAGALKLAEGNYRASLF